MVSFENFVKSMPPSLSELKVTPFKIPDDLSAIDMYVKMKQFEVHERKNSIERIMFSVENAVIDFLRSQSV